MLSKETDFFCHSLLDGSLNFVCYVYWGLTIQKNWKGKIDF